LSLEKTIIVFAAAIIAGGINSIAGGGTLISFPALVWAGLNPIVANATNTVAISPGALAAMFGLRNRLRGAMRPAFILTVPSLVGAAVGAVALMATPSHIFTKLAPYLILAATALFSAQELLTQTVGSGVALSGEPAPVKVSAGWWRAAIAIQFLVAIYGGYFGAGMGILIIAELGMLGFTDIHQAIGMRSWLGSCINGVASMLFIAHGLVSWWPAAIMTIGQILGGYGGATVATKLNPKAVRGAVIATGVAMAAALAFNK
jgi:uncharacterized membrane protein YfcA